MPRTLWLCAALVCVAGCTEFPELDAAVGPAVMRQPYPQIQPLDALLAQAGTPAPAEGTAEALLRQRADALRQRADALRATP